MHARMFLLQVPGLGLFLSLSATQRVPLSAPAARRLESSRSLPVPALDEQGVVKLLAGNPALQRYLRAYLCDGVANLADDKASAAYA